MTHVISFRRPEQIRSLTKMTVPPQENPVLHIQRLINLGYKIIDISPPLPSFEQPQAYEDL